MFVLIFVISMLEGDILKVRVINDQMSCFHDEYKVVKLNYDHVVVREGYDRKSFNREDVEFICENKEEEVIKNYEDIIKIRLDKGVSLVVYTKLINFIEANVNAKIKSINVLKDDYRIIRKGLWEKRLFLIINDKEPVDISIVGRNYSKKFDITIRNVGLEEFIEECGIEINKLQSEIKEREKLAQRYQKAVKEVIDNRIFLSETRALTGY